MSTSDDHKRYLNTPFVPDFSLPKSKFTGEELRLLVRYGTWYSALQERKISPTSPEQVRFLKCIAGEGLPITGPEIVWSRYLALLREASQTGTSSNGDKGGNGVWNRSSFDEIIAMQKAAGGSQVERPHQVTGGVLDQEGENFDPTAIH